MPKRKKKKIAYCGIDESNHGSTPEIFVAVLSDYQNDTIVSQMYNQRIRDPRLIFKHMKKRDWRYTLVSRVHYHAYNSHKIIARASMALIKGFGLDFDLLDIYIDGELQARQIREINNNLPTIHTNVLAVPKKKGNPIRKTNKLIQLADSIANYLFRQKAQEELMCGKISRRKVKFR